MNRHGWKPGGWRAAPTALGILAVMAALIAGSACQKKFRSGAVAGAAVFEQYCSACHLPDSNEGKLGPGFKGLFKRAGLPVSGRPVTDANIRNQLSKPFLNMPAFKSIPEDKLEVLLDYLKTL
jgi:cytochrome c2